jgi:hypothetical protein
MRRHTQLVAAAAAVTLWIPTAAADGWSLHVLGNLRVGWTDNVFSAPDEEIPGVQPQTAEADVYTQVSPGVLLAWERPRLIQEYFYELDANFYVDHSEARGLTHRAGWRAFLLTSPLSELSAQASASGGSLSTFTTLGWAQDGHTIVLPSGDSRFASVEAQEHYSRQLSRPVRVTQTAIGRAFTVWSPTIDATTGDRTWTSTTGFEVGAGIGADRSWRWNALGVLATTSFASLSDGDLEQMTGTVVGSWRRDLSERWSTSVDAGVAALLPLGDDQASTVAPTVGAQVGYVPEWGSAGLTLRRSVVPNVVIQANTINDFALVNAYLPLPWLARDPAQPRFTFGFAAGAGRTTVLDQRSGDPLSRYDVVSGDLSLDYAVRPQMHVAVRYQYIRQLTDDDDGVLNEVNVFDYDRQTVLVSFYGRWPERAAAEVPLRASLRVDRRNVTPAGEEITPAGGTPGRDR